MTPPRQAAVCLKSEDSVSHVSLDFLPAAHSRHSLDAGATARLDVDTGASESLAIALNRPKNICVRQPTRVTLSDASTRPGSALLLTRSTAILNVPPRSASVNLLLAQCLLWSPTPARILSMPKVSSRAVELLDTSSRSTSVERRSNRVSSTLSPRRRYSKSICSSRFTYTNMLALQFKTHLDQFLVAKSVKPRGEHMIRFVGLQNVQSPFIHIYTTSLPLDILPIRVVGGIPLNASWERPFADSVIQHPEELDGTDHPTLWTYLRTIKGASHWSCKAKGFWPCRVVLDGPEGDVVSSPDPIEASPALEDDDSSDCREEVEQSVPQITPAPPEAHDQPLAPSPRRPPRRRDVAPDRGAYCEDSHAVEVVPTRPPPPRRSYTFTSGENGEPPTVLAAVKQLGESVAKAIPTGLEALKSSWSAWAAPRLGEAEQYEADREARREARRERRIARMRDEELEVARGVRQERRAERRAQRQNSFNQS